MLAEKLSRCYRSLSVVFALVLVFASMSKAMQAATPPEQNTLPVEPRITASIDEKNLVPLKNTIHPLANARNDRGAAPDGMKLDRMHLVLTRSASQDATLSQLVHDMHTPGTASYHQWLTPDQFGKQFGPSDQDIATVETWLTGHGFSVTKVNPGKQTIEFSGNAGQMRSAFHTEIHKYVVNGESHYANATIPKIPAALAPVVGGFVSLNNFHARSYAKLLGKASYDSKTDKAKPQWTYGPGSPAIDNSYVLAPQDYAVQYDLNPLYTAGTNGAGQTIAIVNESNINVGLVNQFRTLFGLPANPPQVIIDGNDPGVDGINNPDGPNYASVEAYLDVEWSGAVAPNATVDLVIAADTDLESGLILAAERAVYSNVAPIMSISFGACEADLGGDNTFFNSLWEQAAAQGITVMVSSGDNGSAGCDDDNSQYYALSGQAVNGFGSTPYNVAVGGTDFYYSSYNQSTSAIDSQLATYWSTTASNNTPAVSIKGVIPEQPWNDSQYGLNLFDVYSESGDTETSIAGGSGGASALYGKPAWQSGKGVPVDAARDLPDVSLFASNGANASFYPLCAVDGDCQPVSSSGAVQISGVGGTSASAPSFAGMMALVNQKYGRQGQADFVLYPLATQFPAAFHDVTAGTNTMPCEISPSATLDCISVSNPATVTDPNFGEATEGEIGAGSTAEYNATAGYDLASGLGTIDANQLVTNWGSVKFAATTTTLVPSATTFTHGTSITVNGTVTAGNGTPSGDVALMTTSTEPNQQGQTFFNLADGAYTGTTSYLPGGTYNIWGHYGGDTMNAASKSTPLQITVTPESSTLGFVLSPTPGSLSAVDYGTQVGLSAQPAPASGATEFTIPTGTVTFKDGSSAINTAVVNAEGEAYYNAPFSQGTHSVSASYSGDQSYSASSAAALSFTVVKDSPLIGLSSANQDQNGDYLTGQPTIFNIQIVNNAQYIVGSQAVPVAAPTGTVTISGFPSGTPTSATLKSAVLGTAVEGIATFTAPATVPAGTYNVTVKYAGDANYSSVSETGSIQFVTENGLATTTVATATGSISPTTSISISGTVTGQSGHAAPTGGVLVYSSGNYISEAALVAGTSDAASFTIVLNSQSLTQGANFITLQYTGDATYDTSATTVSSINPVQNSLSDFTLVPQSTLVAVAAPGDSGTVPITISSVNGFSGAVSLKATAATGIGVTIPATVSLSSSGSQTASLTLASSDTAGSGTFNVLVTATDSTGKYVHTAGLQLVVGGNVAPTPGFSLSNSGNISLTAGATTGNTSSITVTPSNGFDSTVTLSCTVTAPSGASSPATCALASSTVANGTGTDVVTITTTSSTTTGSYGITVTGTSGMLTETTTFTASVSSNPSFTLTNSGNITVAAGATTGNTSTITVKPSGGFTGAVSLSCSISPTAASDPATCSLASSTVTGSGTDVLTVSTTAATSALNKPAEKPTGLLWPSAGGAALALVCLFGIPARRRRNWMAMLALAAFFASIAAIGCGGGGSGGGGGGGNAGTTAGTYTVTVTGTGTGASGTITQTTAVTLTVQ
jgi:subtilase family serine protease